MELYAVCQATKRSPNASEGGTRAGKRTAALQSAWSLVWAGATTKTTPANFGHCQLTSPRFILYSKRCIETIVYCMGFCLTPWIEERIDGVASIIWTAALSRAILGVYFPFAPRLPLYQPPFCRTAMVPCHLAAMVTLPTIGVPETLPH